MIGSSWALIASEYYRALLARLLRYESLTDPDEETTPMDDAPRDVLSWSTQYSMIHGRVVSLTIHANTFPQERFLSDAEAILASGDPLLLKVSGVMPDGSLRITALGDVSLDLPSAGDL